MASREFTIVVQAGLWSALEPLGYTKLKPNRFSRTVEDVLLIVDVQKGKYTTANRLEITVNLGVLSFPLNRILGEDYQKPDIGLCNWRARIGHMMPENADKWWEIQTDVQATLAAKEIADVVTTYGLPAMQRVAATANLYAIWKSGDCAGLSSFLREKYVSLLEKHWIKKE